MTHRSLAAAALALAALIGCGGGGGGEGGTPRSGVVAMLSPTYVQLVPDDPTNPTDRSAEGLNLETALTGGAGLFGAGVTGLGLTITKLESADTTDLTAALAGRKVLVIPEQEVRSWTGDLSYDAIVALRDFVRDGGTIVEFWASDHTLDLVDGVMETALVAHYYSAGTTVAKAAGATGTPFASGPATILTNDATAGIESASLPASARVLYEVEGASAVTLFTKGAGHIVVFGWDFYIGTPAPEIQPWVDVLGIAATNL